MKSDEYRAIAFSYYPKKCQSCGTERDVEVHHINGDTSNNKISNLIPLCSTCHKKVEARSARISMRNVDKEITTTNPLLVWLIRVKRLKRSKDLVKGEDKHANRCRNPKCRGTLIGIEDICCTDRCKEKFEEFKQWTESVTPNEIAVPDQ